MITEKTVESALQYTLPVRGWRLKTPWSITSPRAEVAENSRVMFVPAMVMILTWLFETVAVFGVNSGCMRLGPVNPLQLGVMTKTLGIL